MVCVTAAQPQSIDSVDLISAVAQVLPSNEEMWCSSHSNESPLTEAA
jgi:hypothetical protein